MTKGQLVKFYGKGSEKIVDQLCERKKSQGLFRRHPEMPESDDFVLYWCLREMSKSTINRNVVQGLLHKKKTQRILTQSQQ